MLKMNPLQMLKQREVYLCCYILVAKRSREPRSEMAKIVKVIQLAHK